MKRFNIIIVVFVAILAVTSCNVNKQARKKAKRAFEYYSKGDKLKAARMFERINEKYPESNVYDRTLFNIAYTYEEIDSLEKANHYYKIILESSLVDSTRDSTRGNDETHTNFKHYAAKNLARIHRQQGEYRTALKYAEMARFKYPYYHDNSRQRRREELSVDHSRSLAYEALGELDSAVYVLLPHALNYSPWSRESAEEYILPLIDEWIGREAFLEKLDKALKGLKVEPSFAYFTIDGFQIQIVPWGGKRDILSESRIRRTHFYRALEGKL